MQVPGGSQRFSAVSTLRLLGRWMRMFTTPNPSSVAKAFSAFDDNGRMKPSSQYDGDAVGRRWCGRPGSNRHSFRNRILSPVGITAARCNLKTFSLRQEVCANQCAYGRDESIIVLGPTFCPARPAQAIEFSTLPRHDLPMLARYDIRPDEEGWTVFDVWTGCPAVVEGTRQEGLELQTADALADALGRLAERGVRVP